MIRVVLLGRTGNHLFQYALGRVLAEKHGVPLMLDGSWFTGEAWRQVSCLQRLGLKARLVRRLPLAARFLRKVTGRHYWEYRGVPVFREREGLHCFDGAMLEASADCVLFGYFQTPRYFAAMAPALRDELGMDHLPWSGGTRAMAETIRADGSVAVHVRRCDYAGNPMLEVCDEAYYRRAMDRMRAGQAGVRFFVFSDDPAWCRDAFREPDTTVCDLPEAKGDPLHDLHLMSLARHHIIANSSYSWWAAWLGKKPGQRVLCPPRWFNHGIEAPIEEKLCEGWEVVDR